MKNELTSVEADVFQPDWPKNVVESKRPTDAQAAKELQSLLLTEDKYRRFVGRLAGLNSKSESPDWNTSEVVV
jgi:hypothetical protein